MIERRCKHCNAPLLIKLCEIPSKFARRQFCDKSCSNQWKATKEAVKQRPQDPTEEEIHARASAIREGWSDSRFGRQRGFEIPVLPEPVITKVR